MSLSLTDLTDVLRKFLCFLYLQTQWTLYQGKCGVCGDPWPGPRENEPGGKYATGTIVRNYQVGQVIDVYIQLTANHKVGGDHDYSRNTFSGKIKV